MRVNRRELIKQLDICKPALATQNRAVELSHFWFDGETISAYNGRLLISVPTDIDIVGGIPHTALDWLKRVETAEINLIGEGSKLTMTAGRARINIVLLDIARRIYSTEIDFNELGVPPISLDPELVSALENVSVSQDKNATTPAKLGVFFHPHDGRLDLYATDDATITKQTVTLPDTLSDSLLFVSYIVIPFGFIDQIIEYKKTPGACLYINDNMVVLYAEPVTVISSLVACSSMPEFDRIFESFEAPMIAIPKDIEEVLDRLYSVSGPIEMIINNNNLSLASEAGGSRAEEEFPLEGSNSGGILVKLDPKLLKRVIEGREQLGIKPKGVCFTGPTGYIHIMAALK